MAQCMEVPVITPYNCPGEKLYTAEKTPHIYITFENGVRKRTIIYEENSKYKKPKKSINTLQYLCTLVATIAHCFIKMIVDLITH